MLLPKCEWCDSKKLEFIKQQEATELKRHSINDWIFSSTEIFRRKSEN